MRRIIKNNPPGTFVTYTQTQGATFRDMPTNLKDEVKEALLNEQGWVCGYCQQKIKTLAQASIEHFCEQSICNGQNGYQDKRLVYTNFMAVCCGDAGFGQLHCDKSKANFSSANGLPIEISPWNSPHMNAISYKNSGLLVSSIDLHSWEIDKILNLNLKFLKERRKKKYIDIFSMSKYKDTAKQKDKMRRLLEKDLEMNGNKFSNDFPGLSQWMMRKYCR